VLKYDDIPNKLVRSLRDILDPIEPFAARAVDDQRHGVAAPLQRMRHPDSRGDPAANAAVARRAPVVDDVAIRAVDRHAVRHALS
jgi:hypothetical protein